MPGSYFIDNGFPEGLYRFTVVAANSDIHAFPVVKNMRVDKTAPIVVSVWPLPGLREDSSSGHIISNADTIIFELKDSLGFYWDNNKDNLVSNPPDIFENKIIFNFSLDLKKNKGNLKFNKNQFQFNNNQGRSHARSKGIELASGEWVLFLNSNIRVESNLILKYSESIWKNTAYAFGGCINYTSTDSIFEKYLSKINLNSLNL